jgi:phosphoribosyl-dephospho-CoA transferase
MAGVHDQLASTVSLARVILGGVDRTQEHTSVRTATLVLILETLIENNTPLQNARVMESTGREIGSLMASFASVKEQHGK